MGVKDVDYKDVAFNPRMALGLAIGIMLWYPNSQLDLWYNHPREMRCVAWLIRFGARGGGSAKRSKNTGFRYGW